MTSSDPKTIAKDMVDNAEAGVDLASENMREVGSGIAAQTRQTASDVTAKAKNASGVVRDAYETTKQTLGDMQDGLPQSASEAMAAGRRAYARGSDSLDKQVAKQPIEALLLAGAIGYLIGWATARS